MPSKRPSLSAMDAGAAAASLSPHRSKKRSSRPNPRMDGDRPEPNPSSRGSPAGASSRKSERERRPRAFTDSAVVTAPAAAGPHDRRVRDLCNNVWGAHLVPPAEDDAEADEGGANERCTVPDAAAILPVVTEVLDGYWKTNGRAVSGVSLENGLSLLGTEDARSVEAKWKRQHDLSKEVYGLLIDTIKGLGP